VNTTRVLGAEALARANEPRDDLIAEAADGPGRFVLAQGPLRDYERTLTVTPLTDGRSSVTQHISYRIAAPGWQWLYAWPVRRSMRRLPAPARAPWWAPPSRVDADVSISLAALCTLSVVVGYLGTVISQTLTFAADEFDRGKTAQSATLAAVRIGVFLSVLVTGMADRRGRKPLLVWGTVAACIATAAGALAPEMITLGITQTIARGLATGLGVLLVVLVAEELPAGSRAYGISVLALSAALGSGMVVWVLPVADLNVHAWRLVYALPLLAIPLVLIAGRHLRESRRYLDAASSEHHGEVRPTPDANGRRRLVLLGVSSFLLLAFRAPASQLQNEFLRSERGYSAAGITVFTLCTSTPAGVGVFLGGRLADTHGRRSVGAFGLLGGATAIVATFMTHGVALWIWAVIGSVVGGLTISSLGVYGPELFGTADRGRANGHITVLGVCGSSLGLLAAGVIGDRWSLGLAMAVLAVGPVIVAFLVITRYPETAGLELELINPQDATLGHGPGAPSDPTQAGSVT
jgi:MFS family permease